MTKDKMELEDVYLSADDLSVAMRQLILAKAELTNLFVEASEHADLLNSKDKEKLEAPFTQAEHLTINIALKVEKSTLCFDVLFDKFRKLSELNNPHSLQELVDFMDRVIDHLPDKELPEKVKNSIITRLCNYRNVETPEKYINRGSLLIVDDKPDPMKNGERGTSTEVSSLPLLPQRAGT